MQTNVTFVSKVHARQKLQFGWSTCNQHIEDE